MSTIKIVMALMRGVAAESNRNVPDAELRLTFLESKYVVG